MTIYAGRTAALDTLSNYSSSGVGSSCFAEATLECSGCGKCAGMVVAARHLLQWKLKANKVSRFVDVNPRLALIFAGLPG